MGKAEREKGARGEREFRDLLRRHGFTARRYGRNERANADLAHNVGGFHFEVKRRNGFDPVSWLRQARADAGEGELPVAVWKRNNGEWIALMGADELLEAIKKGRISGPSEFSLSPLESIPETEDV